MTVGVSARRKEGPEKLCGLAKYIDDHDLPGCLHGVTLRSSIPYGTIKAIRFDPAFPWDECVIATAKDIPGHNFVALIENDQPLLVEKKVMHQFELIVRAVPLCGTKTLRRQAAQDLAERANALRIALWAQVAAARRPSAGTPARSSSQAIPARTARLTAVRRPDLGASAPYLRARRTSFPLSTRSPIGASSTRWSAWKPPSAVSPRIATTRASWRRCARASSPAASSS